MRRRKIEHFSPYTSPAGLRIRTFHLEVLVKIPTVCLWQHTNLSKGAQKCSKPICPALNTDRRFAWFSLERVGVRRASCVRYRFPPREWNEDKRVNAYLNCAYYKQSESENFFSLSQSVPPCINNTKRPVESAFFPPFPPTKSILRVQLNSPIATTVGLLPVSRPEQQNIQNEL